MASSGIKAMVEPVRQPGDATAEPFISVEGAVLRQDGGGTGPAIWWQILGDQHWAVLGPNGSGKSTLMQRIAGHLPAEAGRIVCHLTEDGAASRPITARDQVNGRQIAYVDFRWPRSFLNRDTPFHQARWNSLSSGDAPLVSEYLSEAAVNCANPYQVVDTLRDPERFQAERARVAALLGIEPLLDRRLVQLSSGERRKVVMARALLQRPRLLILDNPFAGLDQGFRPRLREIIGRLLMDEMRVTVVATEWDDVPAGITHVLLLDRGRVVAQGPRESVLARSAGTGSPEPASSERAAVRLGPSRAGGNSGTSAGSALVDMQAVNITYSGIRILSQVDWTVRCGEHWAVLGPNGAGKSTLLSLLLGDNPQAYANRVTLFGRRRGTGESIWEVKRRIGWAAPELQLLTPAGLSCREVVCSGFFDSVGLYQRCTPWQQEEASHWLERLGLSGLSQAPFGALSEGQQRLVLVARAAVKRPALLVLDEPCQGLDAERRDLVLDAVDGIGRSLDSSIIYVTHDPRALPGIITHALRLDRGQVTARRPVNGRGVWEWAEPAQRAATARDDGCAR
jgi:molybdate transport system ATP-binding protein